MHLSCTTEFSDFSAVNMGSRSINVIILICTYAPVIEQNNAILNKWLDDSCYFPGENFGYSISTVTRKFPVNSNGRMERLMCNFHYLGYYCSPNLSNHQNRTQEPTWNFLVTLAKTYVPPKNKYFVL